MPVRTSWCDDQLKSRLARMPPELLESITSGLPTPDLGSLRLSCKLLERRLFPSFAVEFFGKKQFMLTHFSLGALIDIAKHEDLSPFVTEVQLGTDRYYNPNPMAPMSDDQWLRYQANRASQMELLDCGHHCHMLTEAFSYLRNLRKVVIRDNNSEGRHRDLDPNAITTSRIKNTGHWKSYGASSVDSYAQMTDRDHVNCRDILSVSQSQYVSRMWKAVLNSLAATPLAQSCRHIELLLRYETSCLQHNLLEIPEWRVPTVSPVLRRLEVLHLTIGFGQEIGPNTAPQNDPMGLEKLLSLTPNLRHLRINGCRESRGPWAEKNLQNLLLWLAHDLPPLPTSTTPGSHKPRSPPYVTFSYLEQLDFGKFQQFDAQALVKCLVKLSSMVTGLAFRHISLIADPAKKTLAWPMVLKAIGTRMPKLQSLNIMSVGQYDKSRQRWYPVFFNKQDTNNWNIRYHGNWMGEFCDNLLRNLEVQWPQYASIPGSDDENDDEDINTDDEGTDNSEDSQVTGIGMTDAT